MKNITRSLAIILLLSPIAISAQSRGDLVSDSLALTLTKADILAVYDTFNLPENLFPIDFDLLELHRIVYRTPDGRGENLTLASGLVTLPIDASCTFPLLNYNHGSLMYDETLSEFMAKLNQHFIGVPFAANGYVTALPDFLGYGATPLDHPHPYIHAKSEATAVVDMLRATRTLCAARGVQLNDQLFLLGYSQGGHVTMAAHRALEQLHAGEFTVTASAPCSGPYDFSGILRDSMLHSQTFSNPFFIAFGTTAYQYIYQNLYAEIGEMFQAPYDSMILRMLDRRNPQSSLRDSLPEPGFQMFQPDYLAEVLADSLHPLNTDIRDNDVYDWLPQAPVRLYYCTADEQIPYVNALFTANYMSGLGADIDAVNAGSFDHFSCTPFALILSKLWFDTYRTPCAVGVDDLADNGPAELFPNPFRDELTVCLPGQASGRLLLTDLLGRPVYEHTVYDNKAVSVPAVLAPGAYVARVSAGGRTTVAKVVKSGR